MSNLTLILLVTDPLPEHVPLQIEAGLASQCPTLMKEVVEAIAGHFGGNGAAVKEGCNQKMIQVPSWELKNIPSKIMF